MHAYNRLPSSGQSSPSAPSSPRSRSPHRRSKPPPRFVGPKTLPQHLAWHFLSFLLQRQTIFLFAPFIYISGILLYMDTVSFYNLPAPHYAPGSIYRSPQLYGNLRPEMESDSSTADAISTIWKNSYKGGEWRPCIDKSSRGLPESNGYIYIEANGGLNQQRTSICNAVAVAGYLNATLIIPHFHFHSIWRDPSKFSDIYDEEFFVKTLKNDVRVVDKVPDLIMERFDNNMTKVYNFRIKAWSSIYYYGDTVHPKLLEEKIVRISPFANRLSFDAPPAVQRLRCLANYEALRFSNPILSLGQTLVARMKDRSANNSGKYISVHLRFEEDMVAFSCCIYDGGGKEKIDMDAARERGWRGKFTKRGKVIHPGAIRINGKCPLTPLEVGLMLRGMGFGKSTSIYLASGKIYDSERHMKSLLEMFPLLQTKEMLASPEELAPFQNYSSRMAAIDYTVCLHSEVFVTTQGGNFPHFLLGHRRFLYGGHSKTIRPDKRKLALLFDNTNIGWKSFKRQMLNIRAHSDSKGIEIKRPSDSVYSVPCPDCMCRSNKTDVSKSSSAA
ncbi:putative multiple C2 and transmembrane domain-containing protein 1-like [Capsicum annuum]|uniref:protein ESMERALDA 1 isoform X1 n=1 Tax=Capsicum annuum TaxID=4072 RepID=UPI0007BEB59B|nr:protein ESMERALDA 1 isoform X1 [Capsicum annuum]KAF3677078.1 putative multiple C2 and transmembrane domain-containing protein 1-like [Capsicum annuum]